MKYISIFSNTVFTTQKIHAKNAINIHKHTHTHTHTHGPCQAVITTVLAHMHSPNREKRSPNESGWDKGRGEDGGEERRERMWPLSLGFGLTDSLVKWSFASSNLSCAWFIQYVVCVCLCVYGV